MVLHRQLRQKCVAFGLNRYEFRNFRIMDTLQYDYHLTKKFIMQHFAHIVIKHIYDIHSSFAFVEYYETLINGINESTKLR